MAMVLTEKQQAAQKVLGGTATHCMLFGGSRCVSGDTVLDGQSMTIADLAAIGAPVEVMTSHGRQMAESPFMKGYERLYRVTLADGRSVKVTGGHRFWNGVKWVQTKDLLAGANLAVRGTSAQTPLASSSECVLSAFRAGVRRLTDKARDCLGGYCGYSRQGDAQPLHGPVGDLVCRALSFDGLAHSLPSGLPRERESDSRTRYRCGLGQAGIQSDPSSRPQTSLGGLAFGAAHSLRDTSGFECAGAWPRNRRLFQRLSLQLSEFRRIAAGLVHDCVSRFFPLRTVSAYDTPDVNGYALSEIVDISEAGDAPFYTLHVPGCEHYFANGILHHNSGKTALLTRAVALRAQKAPKSRHAILRFRFNHVKTSVVADTWPKVMAMAFPGVKYEMNRTDWYAEFENGSQVWFGGLDDKERTEKILGNEYSTIYLNECSQIPGGSRDIAVTRLAQKCDQVINDGKGGEIRRPLAVRMFYDCNPTSKAHWSYLRFVKKIDPDSKLPLRNPDDYAHFQINPGDNAANLSCSGGSCSGNSRMQLLTLSGPTKFSTSGASWKGTDSPTCSGSSSGWIRPARKTPVVTATRSGSSSAALERTEMHTFWKT
jgi:hypothetical protein